MTFDPFRSPLLPAANLSEVGNASFNVRNTGSNQYLVTALYRDVAVMSLQDRRVILYQHQEKGKLKQGRGPSTVTMAKRSRKKQMAMAEEYGEALGSTLAKTMEVCIATLLYNATLE